MNGEGDVVGENYGVWSEVGTDRVVFKITREGEERHEEEKTVDKSIGRFSWGPAGNSSRGHRAKRGRGSFDR
jgi:hypothetical protein